MSVQRLLDMIHLTRYIDFEASHYYYLPELSEKENYQFFGNKVNQHGHNYSVHLTIGGKIQSSNGMVINIKDVDELIRSYINQYYDHKQINQQHPVFSADPSLQPTPENISIELWRATSQDLATLGVHMHSIRLTEEERTYVQYYGVEPVIHLTRTYEFSAAHRLHSSELSDYENTEIFGKCNNPNGHGHNYVLDVTLSGEIDQRTGLLVRIVDLDQVINKKVFGRFDHKHLNLDTVEFQTLNPTSENFVRVLWELIEADILSLAPSRSVRLHRLRLKETPKSFFDYYGG